MIISGKCGCGLGRTMRVVTEGAEAQAQAQADKAACECCPDCNPDYIPPDFGRMVLHGGYHVSGWDRRKV